MKRSDEEKRKAREKRQADLESNAEYQRRKMMTSEERAKGAIERISKDIHEQNQKDGKNSTYTAALKKAQEIAEKAERRK